MINFENFVVIYMHGGLGTQLYQFAFGKALSKKLNCKLIIDKSYYDQKNNQFPETFRLENFNIDSEVKFVSGTFKFRIQSLNFIKKIFGNKCSFKFLLNFLFNIKIDNIFIENFLEADLEILNNSKVNSAYHGYWEHLNFFDNIKNDVVTNLSQKNLDFKKIENFQNKFLMKNSLAIHFSDTRLWPNLFEELDDKYYIDGIKHFENLSGIDNIHVFVQNKEYAYNRLSKININSKLVYISDFDFTTMEEFYILRKFKNYIISRSTFGWWASYLSTYENKNIVAPNNWWVKNKNSNINEGRITSNMKVI